MERRQAITKLGFLSQSNATRELRKKEEQLLRLIGKTPSKGRRL